MSPTLLCDMLSLSLQVMSRGAIHDGLVSLHELGILKLVALTVQYITKSKAPGSTED